MKDAEKFRLSLQQKVPRPQEEPSHIIDKEIQRVNDKFKGKYLCLEILFFIYWISLHF